MPAIVKVGTRPSRLALKQVDEIQNKLPGVILQKVPIQTRGDKDKSSSLIGREDSDFFTYEIEQALLEGEIDAAIHSAKDLEKSMPEELIIAAMTVSLSPFECLVSKNNYPLDKLPAGACVATSSRKRRVALKRYRQDLKIKGIRGNIEERLQQLDRGDFDAVVIAHAALLRLGLEQRSAQVIPPEIMAPHPLQGRIAVQIHRKRKDLFEIFRRLDGK